MEQFELLGGLAIKLHMQFRNLFYLMLPVFFALSLVITWFRNPQGGADISYTDQTSLHRHFAISEL